MSHFFKTERPARGLVESITHHEDFVSRRIDLIVGFVVVAVSSTAVQLQAQQPAAIDRAAWLAGCWEMRTANRITMEMWMPPAGGTMMGASRTTTGSATREFEQLRLWAAGDTLVYTALPSGQRQAEFRSTSVSATTLVFENPTHDFPRKLTYRKVREDSLVARVEGPGPNNTTRGFDIPMRRASCTQPPAPPSR